MLYQTITIIAAFLLFYSLFADGNLHHLAQRDFTRHYRQSLGVTIYGKQRCQSHSTFIKKRHLLRRFFPF